ncbi:hypothetical protein TWF481_004822 [Arthrobotrys musiformis]|uniref:Aminoglycoside phosphotransferase domain-containing protein n=1 Tax=Arthrobotrys musiformis TaxID=47236 RepID=A0AAV9WKP8_9PEZI
MFLGFLILIYRFIYWIFIAPAALYELWAQDHVEPLPYASRRAPRLQPKTTPSGESGSKTEAAAPSETTTANEPKPDPDDEAILESSKNLTYYSSKQFVKLVHELELKYNYKPNPKAEETTPNSKRIEADALEKTFLYAQTRISPGYTAHALRWCSSYFNPTVVKDYKAAVDLARSLGVRTPPVVRTCELLSPPEWWPYTMCISPYIPGGESLDELIRGPMSRIDAEEIKRLALQLRDMLETMHRKIGKYAGGIDSREFYKGNKFLGDDTTYGITKDATMGTDLARIVNFWWGYVPHRGRRIKRRVRRRSDMTAEQMEWAVKNGPISVSEHLPLVFTHYDLKPRNLIRDNSGDLWIINWDHAGWYPAVFDRASMNPDSDDEPMDSLGSQLWDLFVLTASDCNRAVQAEAINHAEDAAKDWYSGDRLRSIELGLTKAGEPPIIDRWPERSYRPV